MKQSSGKPETVKSGINPAALVEDIKKKLAETNEKRALMPPEEETVAPSTEVGVDNMTKRRLYLKQLAYTYEALLSRLENLQAGLKRRIELEKEATDWSGFSEQSAHPFLRADELEELVRTLSKRHDEIESWIDAIDATGLLIVNTVENSTVKLRQADEAVERAKNSPDLQALLSSDRDLLLLQNQMDAARAIGFQIEKQTVQEELVETRARLQLATKQLGVASEHVELTQQDLEQVHKNIEIESQHIIHELNYLVSEFEALNQGKPVPDITGRAAQPQLAEPAAIEQLRQAQRENADIKQLMLSRILAYLELKRDIWNFRWAYAKVTDHEKAREAYDKIAKNQVFLKSVRDYISKLRQRVLERVTDQAVKEINFGVTVTESHILRNELRNLDLDQVVSYSRLLGAIESTENLLDRCKLELDARFRVISFTDHLKEAFFTARDFLSQVWTFELFAAQDTIEVDGQQISGKRSITVDKVVTALAILIFGYMIAVRLANLIERLSVTRFDMDPSQAHIVRRWIMFLQVMILVVASMMVVRIPLTVFAFMGGAVAIGAGFGMQNLLKNLISGLMLLIERPFRPGDMVEVGGVRGRVTDIGVRSSHILEANGIETLIPNSTFIEQNVTNWTLSDQSVRIVVNIGVAYGSPIKEVTRLLLEVAERHGLVLNEPAPFVLFEDFGSDALLFGLYIWIELKRDVSWKVITSDLRYMIHKTLDEHGIVIAFPQRDIHIDASRPLEIRVLADAPETGSVKG
ncbi:MAG: mechanosensitive ion channel [Methylococcales bacterium]|nr:mechanosensitive ion channel [Methylococcales bacterium]